MLSFDVRFHNYDVTFHRLAGIQGKQERYEYDENIDPGHGNTDRDGSR